MEVSQLKIDPKHLRFKPMTRSEKIKLRRENVKAYIKSKPAGTVISISEFASVTAQNVPNTYSMVHTMVKRGEILKIQSEERGQRYSWVVNDVSDKVVKTTKTTLRYDLVTLTQKAKEFAWQENSDSLREFIKSLGVKNDAQSTDN